MSDQETLREYLANGSEAAFQTLARRHVNLVYATALRRLGDAGQAEETTQNVFIALARRAPWLRDEVNLAGWLYRATLLEARQRYREEQRRQRREAAAIEMGTTMNRDTSLLKSLASVLDEALMELREKDRRAVLLRFFENKNFHQVGRELGIGEDAAQKRVGKAMEYLTRWFRRRGYGVTTTAVTAAVLAEAAQAAAPAGLAALAAHAAVHTAAVGSLTGFGLVLAKIMTLTKSQMAAACLFAAAGPVAYEWHAVASARADATALRRELDQVQVETRDWQRDWDRWRGDVRAVEDTHQQTLATLAQQRAMTAQARQDGEAGRYRWFENSDYVRVPKTLLNRISLAEYGRIPVVAGGLTREEREQIAPAIKEDGALAPALKETLNISPAEEARVRAAFTDLRRDFQALEQEHTRVTDQPPVMVRDQLRGQQSLTVATEAFPEQGQALAQRLRGELDTILGSERGAALWQQAEGLFAENYLGFGARTRFESVGVDAEKGSESYARSYYSADGQADPRGNLGKGGPLGTLNDDLSKLPEALRAFLAEQRQRQKTQP